MQINFRTVGYLAHITAQKSVKKENIAFAAAKPSRMHDEVVKSVYPELLLLAQDVNPSNKESVQDKAVLLYGVIDDALIANSVQGAAFQNKLVTEELLGLAFNDYIKLRPGSRYYNQMRSILAETKNIAQEKLENNRAKF